MGNNDAPAARADADAVVVPPSVQHLPPLTNMRGRGKKKSMAAASGPGVDGIAAALAGGDRLGTNRHEKRPHHKSPPPPARSRSRRRNAQFHHEIAKWWAPPPVENEGAAKRPAAVGGGDPGDTFLRDGSEVTNFTGLSEGENWVACSLHEHTNENNGPPHVSIIKGHKNLYLEHGHVKGRGAKPMNGADESLEGVSISGGDFAILCIDVDKKGHCVTVKDIRQSDCQSDAGQNKEGGFEVFLARSRSRRGQVKKNMPEKPKVVNFQEDPAGDKDEALFVGSASDDQSTNGYGTDDEKDANDEIEELNERNEVRFCHLNPAFETADHAVEGGTRHHADPPREADEDNGKLLYHHPELLPRRQMRVLRNGDRILMRYWPPGHPISPNKAHGQYAPCIKLEYLYGKHHQQSQTQPHHISTNMAGTTENEEAVGKPRLLSVKSPDVKSHEKKRFTLNSTSAAEAPSEDAVENAKKIGKSDGNHKAGEDWSAVQTAKKGQGVAEMRGKQEKAELKGKNAYEDDGMGDEYSYLTGEVMVKDQDYISAITGDNATTPPAVAGKTAGDGKGREENDGDAATASAVVLGATSPPKTMVPASCRERDTDQRGIHAENGKRIANDAHNDCNKKEGFKASPDNSKPNEKGEKVVFLEDTAGEANVAEDNFLTAQTSENNSAVGEGNGSEEELLSQPDDEASDMKLDIIEAIEARHDESDDTETDVSKTQPFILPKNVLQKASLRSLSIAEEDEDDDSTVCPEHNEGENIVENGSDGEEGRSQSPKKLGFVPGSSKNEMEEGKRDSDEVFDGQSAEPRADVGISPTNEFQQDNAPRDQMTEQNADENHSQHTQEFPFTPTEEGGTNRDSGLPQTFGGHDGDDVSEGEPTQRFPLVKPGGKVAAKSQDEIEDDYQAETQNDDDIYNQETQPLLALNLPLKTLDAKEDTGANSEAPSSKVDEENQRASSLPSATQNNLAKEAEAEARIHVSLAHNEENLSSKLKSPAKNEAIANGSFKEAVDLQASNEAGNQVPVSTEAQCTPPPPAAKATNIGPKRSDEKTQENISSPAKEQHQASTAMYGDSTVQKQRIENSAVHRISSGAIVTGPVGGAVAFPGPKQEPRDNLLVSYAMRSNAVNPNPLPDAASEETTVCHAYRKKEQVSPGLEEARDEKVARPAPSKENAFEEKDHDDFRDPNIPGSIEVCINTRGGHGKHSTEGLTTPRSRRKRGGLSSGRKRQSHGIKIIFTGLEPTHRHKQMVNDIGAQLVDSIEDAMSATHVIASDGKSKLRRTPKLMICVCRTSRILSIEWLEQSAKEQRALNSDDFLLLGDREAEKRYNFSMKKTLENGKKARLERDGVLGGWSVYIGTGVAGNNAPSAKELNLVVEATGAFLLSKLSDMTDPLKTIIITSDPCTNAQRSEKGVERAKGLGAKLLSTSWLFNTIITQKMSSVEGADSRKQRSKSKRKATNSPPNSQRRKSRRR
ncbi:hypothetical protein ACHAWF_012987 [Thalassiosira exigua]